VADRVLVPLPDGRWLALTAEAFAEALQAGATAMPSPARSQCVEGGATKLASADDMEAATGVPASWFAAQARERRIPFRKIGRYVRFDVAEVLASEALQRRAVPTGQLCTGSQNRKGHANA
jgi:hypothetical protein